MCLAYREFNPCTGEEEIDKTNVNEQLSRFELFSQQVEKAVQESENIYILGDMNVDINRWNNKDYYLKKISEEYQSLLGKNGLELIDFGITWKRVQENGVIKQSALDHLLTNNTSSITSNKKGKVTYSDHSVIWADIATSKQKAKKQKVTSRDLRKLRSNPRKFSEELSKIDWARITEYEDVDSMVDFWTTGTNNVLDILAPKKPKNIGKKKKVQFPKEVGDKLKLLQEMEIEIEQNEASGKVDKGLIKRHNKHKNHINRLQKRIIMEQKGIAITPKSSINEVWKVSQEVLRPGHQVVTQMKIVKDGVEIDKPKELAETFGTFFIEKVDGIVEEIQAHKAKMLERPENASAPTATKNSEFQDSVAPNVTGISKKSPSQDSVAPSVTKNSELQDSVAPIVTRNSQKSPLQDSDAPDVTKNSELQDSVAPIVTRNLQKSPLQDSVAPSVTKNSEVQDSVAPSVTRSLQECPIQDSVAPTVTRNSEVLQDDPLGPLKEKYKDSELHFSLKKVTTQQVNKIIKKLKKKTSAGFDEISAEMLKMGLNVLAEPLTQIINKSIETGKFPSKWKHSKVCPIYKKGDRKLLKNYRPVSLISVPGMVLERCIGIQMEDYFEENQVLQEFQFGFRRNKSCISELLTLFNKLLRFKEQGKEISLLLFDLSAAFDTVDQSILVSKLQIYGFDKAALNWVKSYLTDRTQQVIVSGELSSVSKTNRGTPQGSRISPLLFLILMADLNLCVQKGLLTNFADDTQLTTVEETEEKAKETTKAQAEKIIEFFSNVQLKNNPDKAALIYNSKGKEKKIQMEVGGEILETAASEKLLGLTVNSDLNWTTHVDKLSTTLKQRLGLLRRLKYKVNSHKLQIVAEAIFQSKIRYGISVYTIPKFEFHNLEQAMDPNITKLQVIQNDMVRLLKGKDRKSHTNMEKLRQELK